MFCHPINHPKTIFLMNTHLLFGKNLLRYSYCNSSIIAGHLTKTLMNYIVKAPQSRYLSKTLLHFHNQSREIRSVISNHFPSQKNRDKSIGFHAIQTSWFPNEIHKILFNQLVKPQRFFEITNGDFYGFTKQLKIAIHNFY